MSLVQNVYSDITINPLDFIKDTFSKKFEIVDILAVDYLSYILIEDSNTGNRKIYRLGLMGSECSYLKTSSLEVNVIVSFYFNLF